ncbi:MAG: histidine kinase, partial [Candidatus Baltobacteraceae bacterium]
MRPPLRWVLWFALATAIAMLLFSYHYLDDLANREPGTLARRAIEEATGVYAFFALLPAVLWLTRRFPLTARTWPTVVGIQVLGAIVFSFFHTTLMALARESLFGLLRLGPYDYGNMAYRYPMEFSNDLLSYTVVVGFMFLTDRIRDAQRRALAAAHLESELASARLANLRLQLQPHFLFNTLNAI